MEQSLPKAWKLFKKAVELGSTDAAAALRALHRERAPAQRRASRKLA
jgi:TPR repeat protein